jgi:hypothetical protein
MTELEQYLKLDESAFHKPRAEADEDKLARECRLLMEALPAGVNAAARGAFEDSSGLGKCAAAAVGGFVFSRAWSAGGVGGIVVRGVGSAMGAMSMAELMHTERLRAVSGAMEDTWISAANFNANKQVIASQLGSFLVDCAIATAGGLLGAALGTAGSGFRTSIREWPRTVSNEIAHPFGENVIYHSTANGAVLKLPTGQHYVWNENRPFFETNHQTGITHFGDGSRLTVIPGKKVEFIGAGISKQDQKWIYEADLQTDMHFLDKRATGEWQRIYALGKGTVLEQDSRGYLLTHATGRAESFKSLNSSANQARGRLSFMPDGSRRLELPDRTEVFVDPKGTVWAEGTKRSFLHVEP